MRYTFMLFFRVFVHTELRSANQNPADPISSALPFCPSPVFSYTYNCPLSSQKTALLFSCVYELPFLQFLSFDIHASDGGCRVCVATVLLWRILNDFHDSFA